MASSEVEQINAQIAALENSKIPYKEDYAILEAEEYKICNAIVIYEDLLDQSDSLSTAFRAMSNMHTNNVSFPGMERYLDFSIPQNTNTTLNGNIEDYINDLKKACIEIDEKKEEIGQALKSIQMSIRALENSTPKRVDDMVSGRVKY